MKYFSVDFFCGKMINQEPKINIEDLEQSNSAFQNLMSSTNIGTVFLDRTFRVKFFTPNIRDIFSLNQTDIGRYLADVENFLEDNSKLLADAEYVLDKLEPIEREVRTRSGKCFLMNILPYIIDEKQTSGVVLIFLDITERKLSEEALRQSEEKFRAMVSQTTAGIVQIDLNGNYKFVNDCYCEITGYSREELLRMIIHDITHKDDAANSLEAFDLMLETGKAYTIEKRQVKKDGSIIWVSNSVAIIKDQSGEAESAILVSIDITGRKKTEGDLLESEERYSQLFNTIDEGFCILEMIFDDTGKPSDYRFLEYNPMFEELTGLTESLGKTVREIVPDIEDFWIETYGKVALTGELIRFENYSEVMNRWFDVHASRIGDENSRKVALVFRNVTNRKRSEELLRRSEERLRLIMESVTEYAIIALDTQGIVTGWNSGAENTFGFLPDEIIGKSGDLIFTPEDRANDVPAKEMRTAIEKGRAEDKRFHLRKDGSRFFVSGIMSPLMDGELLGFVKVARDLSKEKNAEEELLRAHDTLEQRVEERTSQLARANEEIQLKIRERLVAEKERVELLKKLVQTQEEERHRIARDLHDQLGQQLTALRLKLESLKSSGETMENIGEEIDEIQTLAKQIDTDAGFLAWELRPTALDDLGLNEALINYVRRWSGQFNIKAETLIDDIDVQNFPPDTEIHLYRILQEVLNNTAKYAKAKCVSVMLKQRNDDLILVIEDDGKGFNVEKQSKIRKDGSGLGLIGVRERVIIIGGTVEIESDPGKGTGVFVRIPLQPKVKTAKKHLIDD